MTVCHLKMLHCTFMHNECLCIKAGVCVHMPVVHLIIKKCDVKYSITNIMLKWSDVAFSHGSPKYFERIPILIFLLHNISFSVLSESVSGFPRSRPMLCTVGGPEAPAATYLGKEKRNLQCSSLTFFFQSHRGLNTDLVFLLTFFTFLFTSFYVFLDPDVEPGSGDYSLS